MEGAKFETVKKEDENVMVTNTKTLFGFLFYTYFRCSSLQCTRRKISRTTRPNPPNQNVVGGNALHYSGEREGIFAIKELHTPSIKPVYREGKIAEAHVRRINPSTAK